MINLILFQSFQTPGTQDPAILSFQRSSVKTGSYVNNSGTTTAVIDNTTSSGSISNNSNLANGMITELGFIEKLLVKIYLVKLI